MPLAPKTPIGPYEVSGLIGAGGMGEVYRAVDTRLGRQVAIKLLVSSGNDRDRLRRFEIETRAVSSLQHINILALFDIGAFQERPYLVSELLEGETLREHLLRSTPEPAEAVALALQLCRGLAAAHDKGIVHRDIKPENLFVTRERILKIFDFGIAKRTEGADGDAREKSEAPVTERTETGAVLGTAGYMAPEQVRGGAADTRSDIFSVGSVLYEMLAGKRAFQRESSLESAYAILKDEPPDLPPSVPPALDRIVRRCLEKDPADRFQSARDLADELDALTTPSAPSPLVRSRVASRTSAGASGGRRRPWRRFLTGLALIVGISAAATGSASWLAWRRAEKAALAPRIKIAVLPFADFTGDAQKAYFADGLTEGMISQLGRLQPDKLAVIARTTVAQYRHTKKSIKEIGQELGVEYILECSVQHADNRMRIDARLIQASDQTQVWSERYDREVKDALVVQSDVAQAVATHIRLKLSPDQTANLSKRSLHPDAYDAYLRGRFASEKMTPEGIRQAAAHFQQAIVLDPNYAAAYAALAQMTVVQQMNGFARPDEVGPRGKSLAIRALELDDKLADAHSQLAFFHLVHEWDWASSQGEFRRAIALDPSNADIRRRYAAELLSSLGLHDAAIAELQRAVELAPLSFTAHTMLGRTYYHARRHDEAVAELTRATALEASPLPRTWLGLALAAKGKYGEAVDELKKTGDMIVACMAARAYVMALAGDHSEAEKVLEQMIARSKTSYVAGNFIAQVYVGLGRNDEAFAWLEKAYADHAFQLIFLRVDPYWDPIRADARFADLVRRVGIPAMGSMDP